MKIWRFFYKYWLIIAIAIMIIAFAVYNTSTAVINKSYDGELWFFLLTTIIKTIPTLGTLVVLLFQAQAKRIAFLMGAANASIYGIAYILIGTALLCHLGSAHFGSHPHLHLFLMEEKLLGQRGALQNHEMVAACGYRLHYFSRLGGMLFRPEQNRDHAAVKLRNT